MAEKRKYIYGNQVANKLPGSDQNFYFRTRTEYVLDANGAATGETKTIVYYAPRAGQRTSSGQVWKDGTADSLEDFTQGGWVEAATTTDGGATYTFSKYTQEDSDVGAIPSGKKVGDEVLGATAQLSLSTSGGIFSETIQNSIINSTVKAQRAGTAPVGLGKVVSAKQKNSPANAQANTVEKAISNPTKINFNVGKANVRKEYGDYYYPETLSTESESKNKQDRIIFTMKTSEGSIIDPKFGAKTIQRNLGGAIKGSVTLPIQPSISDSNSVDWQGSNLNSVGAFAAGASLSLMGSPTINDLGSNVGKILGGISKELRENKNKTYSNALKVYLAQEAVGLQGLLSRATGAILNPNMELLFNAPSLRPFTFTFRLSPRSSTEAKQVKNIIRFFKQGMSVKTTETSVFLKAPNVFDIRYQTYDTNGKPIKDHPSLNRIKTCALTACDVNYTPDGTYMTFDDGTRTMTSYELSLRFTELDPVYDSDYSDSKGNVVADTSIISGFNPNSTAIGKDEIGF